MASVVTVQHTRPPVLLVGDIDFHEFDATVQWLRAHTQLDALHTVSEALGLFARQQSFWHTVLIAQSRPGQFAQRDVQRLSAALPLAHFVAVLGSCCEGESRSGRPWPGVVRVYWHQFVARAESELRFDAVPTSWQLQRTASDAERIDHSLRTRPEQGEGLVAIRANDALIYGALASACRVAGYSSTWLTTDRPAGADGAAVLLWHCQPSARGECESWERIVTQARPVPVVALMGFPRHDDVQRLTCAGVAAVLSLPLLLPDLWNTLREVTR